MKLIDKLYEFAEFDCWECSYTNDDNGCNEDTLLTIRVSFPEMNFFYFAEIWAKDHVEIGVDLSSKYAIEAINWAAIEKIEDNPEIGLLNSMNK